MQVQAVVPRLLAPVEEAQRIIPIHVRRLAVEDSRLRHPDPRAAPGAISELHPVGRVGIGMQRAAAEQTVARDATGEGREMAA